MRAPNPSRARGASILGVLVLLSILSAAAITLEMGNENITGSLVATTGCTIKDGKEVCEKETAEDTLTKCTPGYHFRVTEKKGSQQPDIKVVVGDQNVINECKSERPKSEVIEASNMRNQAAAVLAATGNRCEDWRCKVTFCVPPDVSGKKELDCIEVPTSYAPGKEIDLKKERKSGVERMLFTGTPQQKQIAANIVSNAPKEFQEGVLSAFNPKVFESLDTAITETGGEIKSIDQQRAILAEECGNSSGLITVSTNEPCYMTDAKLLEQRAAAEQQLQALTETRQRLAAAAEALKATTPEETGGDTCATNPAKCPPSCTGLNCAGSGGGYYGGGGGGTFGNTNSQLQAACQAGNQQACQQLAGNAARPGGGGAPPSQQCSQGITGTIGSAFGTCENAPPQPTCSLTASPQNIASAGQTVQLSWQSQNVFSASLSNAGNIPTQGSMSVQPQQTTTYTMFVQGYRNSQTGQTLSGQCQVQVKVGEDGGTNAGGPKAQISCAPQLADVGMSVAISFGCQSAATSVGSGFSTNNQLSGSATPVIEAPTLGSDNKITYGLTCSKEGKTDSAQCTVQVNKTSIVLVANPKNVASGEEANIGWVTSGMDECVVSSPTLSGFTAEHAGNTNVSGVAKTPPLTDDTDFVLSCITKAGSARAASTTVEVSN